MSWGLQTLTENGALLKGASSSAVASRALLFLFGWALLLATRADVLVGINGERFIGRVIEETPEHVVFESELAGRMTVPRARLVEVQRGAPTTPRVPSPPAAPAAPAAPIMVAATNVLWLPPTVGKDGFDWVQLKSGEWLKGQLHYIQDRTLDFESEELDELSIESKDVRQLITSRPMFTKPEGRDPVYGTIVISNDVVTIIGPEQVSLRRNDITGVTPGAKREIDLWSGKASVGLNFQSGNTHQTTFNASAELARRTPNTTFLLNYVGALSEVEGVETVNDHRTSGIFDIHLSRRLFIRAPYVEYYRDPPANIDLRGTAALGVGYRIFEGDKLEWLVAVGPAFQYTKFHTVEAGEDDHTSTPAAVLQSSFEADITKRLDLILSYGGTFMSEESGLYSHHAVSTLEFEIKKHLDLNISLVWDYLNLPHAEANGVKPQSSDYRLILSLGVKF